MEAAEIVALIGVTGVLSSVVSSFVASTRSLYINSITVERNKWIDKLRTNLAAFCTEARAFTVEFAMSIHSFTEWEKLKNQAEDGQAIPVKPKFDDKSFSEHFRRMQDLSNMIQLQLNPKGAVDQNIIKILASENFADVVDHERITELVAVLILHSQWLLKAEWEKVKYEGGGWLYQWNHRKDENQRKREYLKWVKKTKNMTILVAVSETNSNKDDRLAK